MEMDIHTSYWTFDGMCGVDDRVMHYVYHQIQIPDVSTFYVFSSMSPWNVIIFTGILIIFINNNFIFSLSQYLNDCYQDCSQNLMYPFFFSAGFNIVCCTFAGLCIYLVPEASKSYFRIIVSSRPILTLGFFTGCITCTIANINYLIVI